KNLCDSLKFDPPNSQLRKYKTYHSIFLKNVHHLCTSSNYDFCKYLVDKLKLLVDSLVVEDAEIKLYSNCAIKKKEALFNS
ncbi:13703_t:CDS:2, partial [Gigaspora margarita]